MSTTLVALQQPKDISLGEIEAELNKIWLSQGGGKATPIATRAATFSMVIYEPEEFQQLLAGLGFYKGEIDGVNGIVAREAIKEAQKAYNLPITGRVDSETLAKLRSEWATKSLENRQFPNIDVRGSSVSEVIAAQNPCRVITLCPTFGEDTGVTAQVSAYCPVQKKQSSLICCEYITLHGTREALERVSDVVTSLMIPDLPKFVWWKATPNREQELFRRLCKTSNCIILDSSYFSDPESEFLKMLELIENKTYIADLNWHRLSAWQELTAATFDPPERRASLGEIDTITLDYEKGNVSQALMFLGWFASRLDWQPTTYTETGGDYDIIHIKFIGPNNKEILAELAAISTTDYGEIPGDLVGLRLDSSNPSADCCTILCSETTGCMRLEAGGSAQSCRTEQVSALSDQKAEYLMAQQLQRWGREVLYEDSLAVTVEILKLR
ncbi:MAG: glucose-6-phosphate dehydrogenase assembly protein OpcA [Trichodesmium sp. St16_bin4-tuft]|uniref:OpcA protein n=1 Tax=Trichodesmium erythraeum (strain IMS101) TaxID=203124 RepID=Q118F2_TRIEI|nr:glucose-6-phosphate dehydrogenase assembly protein OpcA [Trichodesmium erythraeum GBRTRLIN201]MCH2049374.1 glucose-6-phosphate dehydrogenase assembly protein OpcA [Trichodesmium sp. ALOHA_ZT_67]MCL2926647.1 glucose-6-phosphate dehydrogenase assembly protein OpcA [Trichodesmium sp. MAG_R01]MDE5068348.1 glucose-6-phosphate dehydrogenase assembly protein OpcA [Trichodesmium sp. St4_bin8_1]MDE5074323.1 glucose-6-phosphate dehydrogenase assembly protein OpcA [Trichodesmium sp. St5_bin8]MDE509192